MFQTEGVRRQHPRWLRILLLLTALLFSNAGAANCQTGADPLINAYVRYNPIFAYYFGNIESYVSQNRSRFVAGGDAVECARRMAQTMTRGAFQSFDPGDRARRDELRAEMGAMGLDPGDGYSSPAADMYMAAVQMQKMADALPYAANGNYGPLYTPQNEFEQMQIFAMQMFNTMMQDPSVVQIFEHLRPQMIELGNIEYRMLMAIARAS